MIQVSRPYITQLEKDYVNEALDFNDIGIGDFLPRFEQSWSEFNFKEYGVACNSGTNALYIALLALGIGKGDEVIVPEFTMAASAWSVSYTGATPIFVDCLDDLTVDPNKIQAVITPNTKAMMIVPIYGRPVSDNVYRIARENNLFIVEDMAEAHGLKPKGDISCFSFYGNKIIATGEGGMCLTDDVRIANEMRLLANMYFDKGRTLIHPKMGYNFRMTNIQAAIGCAQVENIDEILERRRNVAQWYDQYLPQSYLMPKRDVVWVYDIKTNDQEGLKKKLFDNGVESRYFFKPMSMQPMYLSDYSKLNAYAWSKKGLYLPCHPGLTEGEVKAICNIITNK